MEESVAKVVVVDAHPVMREDLKQFLEADGSCLVTAQACDPAVAIENCKAGRHDVVLSTARFPGDQIFDFVGKLKVISKGIKVIICHIEEDPNLLSKFRNCGTDGYIGQLASSGEYSAAVHTVMHGANFFSQNLADLLFGRYRTSFNQSNAYGLTPRETDILSLLANGMCNKEIATHLQLSIRTVETHRFNLRRKTKSNTLSDLVRIARSLGVSGLGEGVHPG